MPARKEKRPDETFPLKLTNKQREALVGATRLPPRIKKRIKEAPNDEQFVAFTKKELEKMEEEIDIAVAYSPPAETKRLNTVLDKIYDLLADIDEKRLREKRQALDRSGSVYQFKVTLNNSDPPIWRRIQVRDCTLGQLHEVLQIVMGWEDSHLHQFIVRGAYYGPHDPDDIDWDMEKHDEEEISISKIVKMGRRVRFSYEYDFGDSWEHEIVFEKTLEPEPKMKYPYCVEGKRACPPEDVGGVWGYADFLQAMADPKHKNHREMKEWIGGKFDSEKFSVDDVNKELQSHD
jgi:hypothetical protein